MSVVKQLLIAGVLVVLAIGGYLAYSFLRTPAEASGPLAAIPLSQSTAAAPTVAVAPTAAQAPAAPTVAAQPTAAPAPSQPAGMVTLQIAQGESEARFIIDEVLNNEPKTVVGTTNQVAGVIEINAQDPTKTRVGVIQVNARSLTTDSNFRNRTIKNQILQTDQYELVTFTPSEIVGLPASGAVGQPYSFQIVGDLTIRDVTKQVTFEVTAKAPSESRVEGTASTTVAYADFGITIPQVRQVASVADQVRLELQFVAVPA